jgi:hypothetical protein
VAIDVVEGKIKSVPQTPGRLPEPNSAPDSSTPSHLNPVAEAVAEVEVLVVLLVFTLEELEVLVVEVLDFIVLVVRVLLEVEEVDFVLDAIVLLEVVVAVPGIHWEYHSL